MKSVAQLHYQERLSHAFSERMRANSRYSLRAFARDLQISPAQLSLLLNGKKGLSEKRGREIAARLGLNERETELFCDSILAAHSRKLSRKLEATARLQASRETSSRSLEIDAFRTVSDWYHFAILQLVQLRNFRSDPIWIARKLGIHGSEVKNAIDRLFRLGLIEECADGTWNCPEDMVFAPDGIPSDAIRKFHTQVLQKALAAVSLQSVDERYLFTTLLPVRLSDLPRAKKKIKDFHAELNQEFSVQDRSADRVYAVSVQLFNLSLNHEGEKS